MGKIVFAGAMSHVLDPDYYDHACGAVGRQKVEAAMVEIARMGERFSATKADALIVVADDHLNAFSFTCVPALCVRIGRHVQRMIQDHAEAFDKVLDHMPVTYPLHEDLANAILEEGVHSGFDLALSWEAPVDHAFLSPVNTMHGDRPIPPLVPIWVNCLLYRPKKYPEFRARFTRDPGCAVADADLTNAERSAFVARDMRRINELGGYLHLVMSIPGLAASQRATT